VNELKSVAKKFKGEQFYILGGGSNTFFTKDFDGVVYKMNIKGITQTKYTGKEVFLEIGAGENWNGLVQYAVNNGYAGIENMTLIPGSVGAAPVQNIAAYGQNLEDVFVSLTAFNLQTSKIEKFSKSECKFAYRDSFFKHKGKGKYIIINVSIKLSKTDIIDTTYHSRYDSIIGELEQFAAPPYNIRDVSKAVQRIRERKFPDWEKVGTAGSFFLNPVITKAQLKNIQKAFPDVQYYPLDKLTYPTPDDPTFDHSDHVKVAAGWLLEEIGWKGKKIGNVGTSPNQALVVVNYGGATAKEILNFTKKMQEDFYKHYKIKLEPEVNII
jgi:UDP-N-acetylmuramate dehydrogenase